LLYSLGWSCSGETRDYYEYYARFDCLCGVAHFDGLRFVVEFFVIEKALLEPPFHVEPR